MKHALLAVLVIAACAVSLATASAGGSITANPAAPTTASGVSFTVSTGGGNRDFASVAVNCSDSPGHIVYATVLTVVVPAKGTATSQTIYPPASSCVADLEKLMQIGKARVLGTVSFAVTP
jgi:hypothetical protein